MGSGGGLNARGAAASVVVTRHVENTDQQTVTITDDRLMLLLKDHLDRISAANAWHAPLGTSLALVLCQLSTEPKEWLLSRYQWDVILAASTIVSLAWLVYTIVRTQKAQTLEALLAEIKHPRTPAAEELMAVPDDDPSPPNSASQASQEHPSTTPGPEVDRQWRLLQKHLLATREPSPAVHTPPMPPDPALREKALLQTLAVLRVSHPTEEQLLDTAHRLPGLYKDAIRWALAYSTKQGFVMQGSDGLFRLSRNGQQALTRLQAQMGLGEAD